MNNILIIGMVIIMIILYLVVLPITRKKQQQKNITQMKEFINNLRKHDKVMMNCGIIGKIKTIHEETIELEIADNTVITIDKMSLIGKVSD
ncbi:preprotein translocase subunit YajC [Vagococcus humatus]|uniref:Preprotein translocase subunit YajC n=2 Tax=Vagococcus humatus TaxID=1889241 RepID=A0A429Z663_9ENTE|nr:preprotein translocase subunit YajC [Vagococcus humatus]